MSPVLHFLTGWLIANIDGLERRDRTVVTLSAIIPDADGLGILVGIASSDSEAGLTFYSLYHHIIAHNLFFGLFITVIALSISRKRIISALLVFICFHIHLLEDILSGRGPEGPDGSIWSISYLYPLYSDFRLQWSGQWELNAWPNVVITAAALLLTLYLAWRRGFSPVNIFSVKADSAVVATLQSRFPVSVNRKHRK